jgi:uncharacterized protein YegL
MLMGLTLPQKNESQILMNDESPFQPSRMNSSALFLTSTGSAAGPKDAAIVVRGEAAAPGQRNPVHLIFNIDISDSMSDTGKLESVKRSMEFIVPLLQLEDLVSIITFGEQSQVILNKVAASNTDTILYKVRALRTDGCTNMSAGLMNINDCLADSPATHKAGVLLLTDGHANRGVSGADGLKQIVQQLLTATPTLTLTTVGYGHDHNINLLRDMATTGAGSYNIVYNLENVATTFGEVLGGLTTVVAQNVVVHFPPETILRTGYATVQTPEGIQVRVGDIYAENEIIILATLPLGAASARVTGHNMRTFASIEEIVPIVDLEAGAAIPKNVEQANFRYRVSTLLKEATTHVTDRPALKQKAEALLAELKDLSYADEQLIQMMIDDMETLLESLEAPPITWGHGPALAATTSQMAQHSAYLALGRGMRTASVPMPPSPTLGAMAGRRIRFGGAASPAASAAGDPDSEAEEGSPAPPLGPTPSARIRTARVDPEASPFMNAPQRHLTSLMRTSSQHPS